MCSFVHPAAGVLCYYLVTLKKIIKGVIVVKYNLIERSSKIIISTTLLKHKQAMVDNNILAYINTTALITRNLNYKCTESFYS